MSAHDARGSDGQVAVAGPGAGNSLFLSRLHTVLIATAVLYDGFDNQLLGFALPAIIRDWGVSKASFRPVMGLGLAGMTLDAAIGGMAADRFGGKAVLLACMMFFSRATGAAAMATNAAWLTKKSLCSGIGDLFPASAIHPASYSPLHLRALAMPLTVVCIPLDGMVGRVVAAWIMTA